MDELDFLRELNKDLSKNPRVLTASETARIFQAIEEYNLVTSMFTAGMICGYGMDIYQHEPYPGTGPQLLLRLTEDDLPKEFCREFKRAAGCGKEDAWNHFSKFTHSEKNKRWLAMYKMQAPREQSHYDY